MTTKRHILVLDSGIGGLTIHDEIAKKMPNASIAYFADHQFFPYGDKDEQWLVERSVAIVRHFIQKCDPELVVVACNTASTVVLPRLRAEFDIHIVGVVPAIKPAGDSLDGGKIGLLATEGTVTRSYTQQLVDDFASHCSFVAVGSNELVKIAEEKLAGKKVSTQDIRNICAPFWNDGVSSVHAIVLGCTHFPFLKEELRSIIPDSVQLIDSGSAIALRVKSLLKPLPSIEAEHSFYSSGEEVLSGPLKKFLFERSFKVLLDKVRF